MAAPKGLQQQFNNIITKISFAGGGLVVFSFKWNAGYLDETPPKGGLRTPPTTPFIEFNFDDSTVDINNFDIMSGDHKVVPDALDKKERDKVVPISDPVTLNMLSHYAGWTPKPPEIKTATTPGVALETWIIDTANFQLVYAGHITSRLAGRVSRDQALAEFKGLIGSTGYEGLDPDKMGVIIEQIPQFDSQGHFLGYFADPPFPPSAAGWAFWSQSGWTGHLDDTPGEPGYGKLAFGYWIMNLSLVKLLMEKKNRTDKKFTFKVKLPAEAQLGVAWELRAQVVQFKDQRSFPILTSPVQDKGFLDTKKAKDPAAPASGTDPKNGGEIEVEITFATKDPKAKDPTPAKVKLTKHVESGGTIG